MKKSHISRLLLAASVVGSLFLASGCSWFDHSAPPESMNTDINGKPMTSSPPLFSDEFKKTDVYDKPVVFKGPATRTDYFCSGGSCDTCENPGTLTITLNTDGTAKFSHVGLCMNYGIKGCGTTEGTCEINMAGSYSKAGSNIALGRCNDGHFQGSGSSKINDTSTSGSARCEGKKDPMMVMEWNDLPKVK